MKKGRLLAKNNDLNPISFPLGEAATPLYSPPGRRRCTDPKATVTRTTRRLDNALLARLDAAVQPLGATRAALLEAMIEARRKGER